jgi:hypothetical protein
MSRISTCVLFMRFFHVCFGTNEAVIKLKGSLTMQIHPFKSEQAHSHASGHIFCLQVLLLSPCFSSYMYCNFKATNSRGPNLSLICYFIISYSHRFALIVLII